jgi:hypothetical protein
MQNENRVEETEDINKQHTSQMYGQYNMGDLSRNESANQSRL